MLEIDKKATQSYQHLLKRFSFVTKTRANIWVTTAVVLFVFGVVVGIIYVANGNSLRTGLSFSTSEAAGTAYLTGAGKDPVSYFTNPTRNTTVKAGTTMNITWLMRGTKRGSVKLILYKGYNYGCYLNFVSYAHICGAPFTSSPSSLSVKSVGGKNGGTYRWNIPSNISGSDFRIVAIVADSSLPSWQYLFQSEPFAILPQPVQLPDFYIKDGNVSPRMPNETNAIEVNKPAIVTFEVANKGGNSTEVPNFGVTFPTGLFPAPSGWSPNIPENTCNKLITFAKDGVCTYAIQVIYNETSTSTKYGSVKLEINVREGIKESDYSNNWGVVNFAVKKPVPPPPIPPSVSLTSPINGASFSAPAKITVSAKATDSDGVVAKVEFYNGSTLLASDTSAPYSFIWTIGISGNFSVKAVAYDNQGLSATSSIVNISVVKAGAPSISITSPLNNQKFVYGTEIPFTTKVSDSDGTITLVEFYEDGVLANKDDTAPYGYTRKFLPMGSHQFYAKAYDNSGNSGTSSPITITVTSN